MIRTRRLLLFLLVALANSPLSLGRSGASSCTIKNERKSQSRGLCLPLTECPAVLSNLHSNIQATRCKGSANTGKICCPIEKRISELKCEKFQDVLKQGEVQPLLPPPFNEEFGRKREVECRPQPNSLIVGGRDAFPGEFPHMVALGWQFDGSTSEISWLCGGTLISDQYVLTAAHCTIAGKKPPTKVLLGDILLRKESKPNANSSNFGRNNRKVLDVEKVIPHPEYKKPLTYNDIALIKLKQSIVHSHIIFPACLPQPADRLERNLKVLNATGWGRLGTAEAQAEILQVARLEPFGRRECDTYFKDALDRELKFPQGIMKTQMCAGDRNVSRDTCSGDSGGGLTINKDKPCIFYVVGITSFGNNVCGHLTPGVYTNVQSYLKWIEDIVWPEAHEV